MPRPRSISVGDKFQNKYGVYTVVAYEDYYNVLVEFEETSHKVITNGSAVLKGLIKDPMIPSICNVGFIGFGNYVTRKNGKRTVESCVWENMIRRCYSKSEDNPTYTDITVCNEWHNFQNFASWFVENYKENFELDKDLRVFGNRIYSPEKCEFIPKRVNSLMAGMFKSDNKYEIGVYLERKKYCAKCYHNGEIFRLGRYNSEQEAFIAYRNFKEPLIKSVSEEEYNLGNISQMIYENLISFHVPSRYMN